MLTLKEMAADPSNQILADLADPAKYVCKDGVVVFRAHKRTDADGKTLYEVTDDDLPEIAKNSNASESAGRLSRLTIGHTDQEKPETKQSAKLVGFAGKYRVQMVTPAGGKPFLGIVNTEYAKADETKALNEKPYRSVEYDPDGKKIHGVAAILNTPYLDLGMVQYSAGPKLFLYSTGIPAMTDDEKKAEEDRKEEEEYAKFAKRMKRYEAWSAEEKAKGEGGTVNNSANTKTVEYAALESRLATMEAETNAAKRVIVEEKSKRLLDRITNKVKFDYARELKSLVSLASDQEREEYAVYMLKHYSSLPTGAMLPLAGAPADTNEGDPATNPTVAPKDYERVMAYVRAHPGISYEAAKAKIVAG